MHHVALLKAVNLGNHNKLGMVELRALFAALGMQDVRTLLQSGNVVFRCRRRSAGLEALFETEATRQLGFATSFFVRNADDWRTIVAANPFPAEARTGPSHLQVLLLKSAPAPHAITDLEAAIRGRERVHVHGRHAYAVYPDGIGKSRLTTALIERKLGTQVTGRNWNTVCKLADLLDR